MNDPTALIVLSPIIAVTVLFIPLFCIAFLLSVLILDVIDWCSRGEKTP